MTCTYPSRITCLCKTVTFSFIRIVKITQLENIVNSVLEVFMGTQRKEREMIAKNVLVHYLAHLTGL